MRDIGDAVVTVVCGLALAAAVTAAQAQALADPTRPPAAAAPSTASGPAEPAPTGLQTIIRRAGAKPAAVINGEYVVLGGRVGDARLVKVGDDSVTLRSAAGLETLKLVPGVEKTMVKEDGKAAGKTSTGKGAKK